MLFYELILIEDQVMTLFLSYASSHTRSRHLEKQIFICECHLSRFPHSVSRHSGIERGLDGAVQRLVVNGNSVEHLMEHATDSGGVSRYEGPPCDESPCLNGGACRPFLRSFVCRCPTDFVGHQCERRECSPFLTVFV